MASSPKRSRWSSVTAEAALVLTALFLAFAAGLAGYLIGRETADDNEPAAAATSSEAATTESTPAETATTETVPTEPATTAGGEDVDGAAVFAAAGCGACHTFGPANSSGTVGPQLDGTSLSKAEIEQQVRNGSGAMPPFGDRLSDAEIAAVADYVESG